MSRVPAIGSLALERMSGAGNHFVVVDRMADTGAEAEVPHVPEVPDGLAALAIELCRLHAVDGMLVLAPPENGGDARMVVFNADGSRPEACGNGLRCVAALARRRGHVARDHFVVETDAGPRRVEVHRRDGDISAATTEMGEPVLGEPQALRVAEADLLGTPVDLGNPHVVVPVEDVDAAPLGEWGGALQGHPAFPQGVNLELCEFAGPLLRTRVFERGVGETLSCGTGACATAAVALRTHRGRSPVAVSMRGGVLEVRWSGTGPVYLRGPVEFGGTP